MNAPLSEPIVPAADLGRLRSAKQIIAAESDVLQQLSRELDVQFSAAVDLLLRCRGRIIVTGMGKAGLIGQKIAATFSSTGSPAHFLHPAEAVHGDLGCIAAADVLLALSNSGETDEIVRLLPSIKQSGTSLIAVTSRATNTLGAAADIVLALGSHSEVGQLQLAPTASTTAMLAMGDALAIVVSEEKGFTRADFARFHPGGSLGLQLKTVRESMRRGDALRIADERQSIREVLVGHRGPDRRTGAVMLVNEQGRLTGLFTDSDLARLLERRADRQLDRPITEVMTPAPITISQQAQLVDAVALLSERRISELPVVDDAGKPVGLIDITDVISLLPDGSAGDRAAPQSIPFRQ